jgi:hypothetical protein
MLHPSDRKRYSLLSSANMLSSQNTMHEHEKNDERHIGDGASVCTD